VRTSDALVVGAGPSGSAAAALLAREGYRVVLLDRAAFPRDKPCGEFVNPGACDLLGSVFGITRDELIEAGGHAITQVRLQLRDAEPLTILLTDAAGSRVSGVSIRRTALDALLVDRCRALGVDVRENHNVRTFERHGSEVAVSGQAGDAPFSLPTRLLIAADGTNSLIARREGLVVPKPRLCSIGLVAHFAEPLSESGAESVTMFPSFGDGLLFGYSPQAGGAVLSGSAPSRDKRRLADDPIGFLRTWAGRQPSLSGLGSPEGGAVRTTACFGHRLRRSFGDRVLFLGDAARFSDPFTGEGIHHALQSAVLAAEVACGALKADDLGAPNLAAYESGRTELTERYTLCELVRAICMNPAISSYVARRLDRRPSLGRTLISALADVVPANRILQPGYLIRALAP